MYSNEKVKEMQKIIAKNLKEVKAKNGQGRIPEDDSFVALAIGFVLFLFFFWAR